MITPNDGCYNVSTKVDVIFLALYLIMHDELICALTFTSFFSLGALPKSKFNT